MDVAACNKQDDPDTQAPSVCVTKLFQMPSYLSLKNAGMYKLCVLVR